MQKAATPGRKPSDTSVDKLSTAAGTTPERILAAGRALFQDRGYERTSMSEIANRVGISAPSVYWHFKSKEEILYSILRSGLTDFYNALSTGPEGTPPTERLSRLVISYVRFQLDQLDNTTGFMNIYGLAQLGHALTTEHLEDLRRVERQVLTLFETILSDGLEKNVFVLDDVAVTAFSLITMCENVTTWAKPDGRLSPSQIAGLLSRLACRMVTSAAEN